MGQISGTVTNASSQAAVEGVKVCALTSADEYRGCMSTESAGAYTFTGLAVGEYRVVFIAPESANYAPQYYDGKAKFAEAEPVSVIVGSTTTDIDAALTAGGQITGTVTDAVTKAALAGAEVCSYNQSSEFEFLGFFDRCTDTNSAGQYTFVGLPGGEYKVSFIGPSGYASQNYNDRSELSEANLVSVTAGSATTGIDAALQPTVGQISGTVTNASTLAAVEGVKVCALTSADEYQGCMSTDSAGAYTFTGLAVGEYRVVFIAPEAANYAPQYYDGKAKFAEADPVPVIVGSTTTDIDAALTAGGQITGTVTDAVTKAPLAGAEVCSYNQSSEFEFFGFFDRCTDTNSAGQYTFVGLPGGEYKVSFIGPSGYASQNYNDRSELSEADLVSVTAGSATTGIDAALQPTAPVLPLPRSKLGRAPRRSRLPQPPPSKSKKAPSRRTARRPRSSGKSRPTKA